jgi:hypothetical protein
MPIVMIGAFRQPSITSPFGKAGGRVCPVTHGCGPAPGPGFAAYGTFRSKSKAVYGPYGCALFFSGQKKSQVPQPRTWNASFTSSGSSDAMGTKPRSG